MQHDAGLAERLNAREIGTVAATGLSPADLDLMLAAGLDGLSADPGGKRRAQFLRNTSSELALSTAWASASGADAAFLDSFPASARFHLCVDRDERLPLAIGEHAVERAERCGDDLLHALARLELALTRARRGDFVRQRPGRGQLVLAPRAESLALPAGTMDAATCLRAALDEGRAPPGGIGLAGNGLEHALVAAAPATSAHRLRDVSVELLGGLAGAFVAAAREPLDDDGLDAFCAANDVPRDELDDFTDTLEADGLVIRGT